MLEKEITFDRFIRGLIILSILVVGVLLVNHLSNVLLPFFLAWFIAYMIYPLVCFLQYRCHLRSRILSIAVALVLIAGVATGMLWIIIPPTINEIAKLSDIISSLANQYLGETNIAQNVDYYLRHYVNQNSIASLIQQDNVQAAIQYTMSQLWSLFYHTMDFIAGLFVIFVILLYIFFILADYEKISQGFIHLIPASKRAFASQLADDVKSGMNAYFRGQSLIALIVGILFAIGFTIIGLPMGIGLGLFIGLLNLVPYLQLIGFIPTILFALLKSMETGQSFWVIMLLALLVFAVVQTIQDLFLTPKIMGRVMGLNPAIILLSLSVWGALLGIIGLIIALPLTTLCLSYYRRFVLKE